MRNAEVPHGIYNAMRVHLTGAEGAGMKWLADYYRSRGNEVSGSDLLTGGHCAANVRGADLVVYSAAVPTDNAELVEAKRLGIRTICRAQALAEAAACFGESIAVAGTHGKTTTTCMLAEILRPYRPAVFFGGTYKGGRGSATGELLIAEACEYKRGFLYMRPSIAVVLNVELDHTDCYRSLAEVKEAFAQFVRGAGIAVLPDSLASEPGGGHCVTVGRTGGYACIDCVCEGGGSRVAIKTPDGVKRFKLSVPGRHNAENAAFAVAAARTFGADYREIEEGLIRFTGADRRLQRVGTTGGAVVFSDYAHHPTELAASVAAYREAGFKHVLVVFQPHTHERLGKFMDGFADVLSGVRSIVLPVFRARGSDEGATSEELAERVRERGGDCVALPLAEAAEMIKKAAPECDAVAVTGAGDNEKILPLILDQSSPNE